MIGSVSRARTLTAVCARSEGKAEMGVVIIRELVGTSPKSWSDAARMAVATAARTVRNIREVEVVKSSARVENGEIVEYRVELKLHFEYEGN
jgi:dodecin